MSTPKSKITEVIPEALLSEEELSTVVILDSSGQSILEKAVKLNNPFEFDPYRFHPSAVAPTFERFLELVENVLANAQEREQVIESERVSITEEYPLERIDRFGDEIITWRLISRKPANMATDAKSRPQRGFGFGYRIRSPLYPDKIITVETRPVDHVIEFSCWAKRARLANRRALWLERTLVNETYAFQVQGIDRFLWEERLADNYLTVGGQPLYQRSLRFFVRLNEFRSKAEPAISHITLESRTTDE